MGGTEIAGFLPELYEILLSVARKTATFHRKINGMDVVQGELIKSRVGWFEKLRSLS